MTMCRLWYARNGHHQQCQNSKMKKMNKSIKLTTVKPSGTLSLLPGVTSGIHPAYARFMYRRINIAAGHPLIEKCREAGYPMEYREQLDGTQDYNTIVVTFPFRYPDGVPLANEMTAIEQLEWVKRLQTDWSDNSVSCTVYYRLEELPQIRKYLQDNYAHSFKSLSFLLHKDHGFKQAPLEEIDEAAYLELAAKTKLITSVDVADFESDDECAAGACPIR